MVSAIVATLAAAFFLYDPIFSFYVSDPREAGELIFFAVTALIGAKCTADITHQKSPAMDLRRARPEQLR
jgi:K+-sensing histidine kinase KdpD